MSGALGPQMCAHGSMIDDDFWYHRKKLVAWGALGSIDYTFQHIKPHSTAWKHLWHQLQSKRCPEYDSEAGVFGSGDAYDSWTKEVEPAQVTISCLPAMRERWFTFLQSVDVPDYEDRFMTEQDQKDFGWRAAFRR